jgi:hypothetical protein
MEENIEIKVATLTNGIKVINLFRDIILFDDGTSVENTDYKLRISSIRSEREPKNVDEWRDNSPPQASYIGLTRIDSIARVEDLEWIRKNIPKDVLILCPKAQAAIYGFPCVTPSWKGRIDENSVEHKIDEFFWSSV